MSNDSSTTRISDLSEIRSQMQSLAALAKSKNTLRIYDIGWQIFCEFCLENGLVSLPSEPETLALFAIWAIYHREPVYSLASVRLWCAAVGFMHVSNGFSSPMDYTVRSVLSGVARTLPRERGAKNALTVWELRLVVGVAKQTVAEIRNRAILLVGFASGWRSVELVGLQFGDVQVFSNYVRLYLRRSKTDQLGKGREIRIPATGTDLCPVGALREYIQVRGSSPGPFFLRLLRSVLSTEHGISGAAVRAIVKQRLRRAGIDPAAYGAHSLRAGMVTTAAENGADVLSISQRTGHKSLDQLSDYVRSRGGFGRDPLAGVL